MTSVADPHTQNFDLSDKYRPNSGPVLLTGVQAIARMLVENHERERDVDAERGILEPEGREDREDRGEREERYIDPDPDPEKTERDDGGLASIPTVETETRRRKHRHARRDTDDAGSQNNGQPSSMWYWGPLRRWRLQDSTVYS